MGLTIRSSIATVAALLAKAAAALVSIAVFLRLFSTGAPVYGGMIAVNTIPKGNSGSRLLPVVESRPPHFVGDILTNAKGLSHEQYASSSACGHCGCTSARFLIGGTSRFYGCACVCIVGFGRLAGRCTRLAAGYQQSLLSDSNGGRRLAGRFGLAGCGYLNSVFAFSQPAGIHRRAACVRLGSIRT